ncbi:MAG: TraB/GumN family protein [Desulfobacterales bacterium]|nr:TraB/GumN family protein [Desulfobacterales bacterium]
MGIKGIVKRFRVQSFIVCLVICLAAFWVSVSTASAQAGAQQKKAFLWSLKTDKATIYLLGSFHLLKADAYPLDKDIETAYRDSKRVVFEADIDAANDPAFQARLLTQGLYPEGQTLEQNISKETYGLLEKKLTEVGLTTAQVNRFKPWLCALTVAALKLKRMGFEPQYGIDGYFFNKAKKDGKEKLFLETLDSQIALFSEVGGDQAEAFLRQTLKDLDVVETMLPDMVGAWKTGDAARLESIMTISFKDYADIYDRFITQRNRVWVDIIEQLLAQGGTTLVVVGAGHLVGPENLLQLLKNKGYAIEQIPASVGTSAITTESLAHAPTLGSEIEEQTQVLSLAIQTGLDQARIQDDRLQQIPHDVYATIRGLLAEAFDPARLDTTVLGKVEAQLSNAETERIRAWLDSPLGKRCSDLYTASLRPQASAEQQEFIANIQKSPIPPARLELIQGLATATKTKDVTLEIAVDTQLVLTTVISTTFPSAEQWPFSKTLDETEKNRLLFEPRVDQQIISLLLNMYSSLSDAELGQYLAFAKSDAGVRYYRALLNGVRLALMEASIRFGAAMADLQWERRQMAGTP